MSQNAGLACGFTICAAIGIGYSVFTLELRLLTFLFIHSCGVCECDLVLYLAHYHRIVVQPPQYGALLLLSPPSSRPCEFVIVVLGFIFGGRGYS